MTIDSNSSQPNPSSNSEPPSDSSANSYSDDRNGSDLGISTADLATQQALAALSSLQSPQNLAALSKSRSTNQDLAKFRTGRPRAIVVTLIAIALVIVGVILNNSIIGIAGTLLALLLSVAVIFPWLQKVISEMVSPQERSLFVAFLGFAAAIVGLFNFTGINNQLYAWGEQINWDAFGTLAEWFGALGQILIAVIAVYVAWRQYVISKDLTIQQNLLTVQQNLITQQQTIDAYFQGVSDLVLDEQGLLEDWPQERAIAEGRTAAIFSSVDGSGKAKIIRFLSRSKLLTPLQRDARLGRAILNGNGGYAEDRLYGVRVIDLGVMLAGADLSNTDLRWTDLSEANLVRANLSKCDLVKTNLTRTILYDAKLIGADFKGTRLFYGTPELASPRSRTQPPNYQTGEYTGAVVENADFSDVQRMSESVRYYCCSWGGEQTRATIPGGCEGIASKLENS